jgi:hypothetical protein
MMVKQEQVDVERKVNQASSKSAVQMRKAISVVKQTSPLQ